MWIAVLELRVVSEGQLPTSSAAHGERRRLNIFFCCSYAQAHQGKSQGELISENEEAARTPPRLGAARGLSPTQGV